MKLVITLCINLSVLLCPSWIQIPIEILSCDKTVLIIFLFLIKCIGLGGDYINSIVNYEFFHLHLTFSRKVKN